MSSSINLQDPSVAIRSSILSMTAIAMKTAGLVVSSSSRCSSIHLVTRMRKDAEEFSMTTCRNLKDINERKIEAQVIGFQLFVYLLPGSVSTN